MSVLPPDMNEFNTTVYHDLLILQARDKMDTVLKGEHKWNEFLADDTATSMPLNRMEVSGLLETTHRKF